MIGLHILLGLLAARACSCRVLVVLVLPGLRSSIRYAPIIGRIFEEQPLFLPLRVTARRRWARRSRSRPTTGCELGRHAT